MSINAIISIGIIVIVFVVNVDCDVIVHVPTWLHCIHDVFIFFALILIQFCIMIINIETVVVVIFDELNIIDVHFAVSDIVSYFEL